MLTSSISGENYSSSAQLQNETPHSTQQQRLLQQQLATMRHPGSNNSNTQRPESTPKPTNFSNEKQPGNLQLAHPELAVLLPCWFI